MRGTEDFRIAIKREGGRGDFSDSGDLEGEPGGGGIREVRKYGLQNCVHKTGDAAFHEGDQTKLHQPKPYHFCPVLLFSDSNSRGLLVLKQAKNQKESQAKEVI
jgi:hypothetical protein